MRLVAPLIALVLAGARPSSAGEGWLTPGTVERIVRGATTIATSRGNVREAGKRVLVDELGRMARERGIGYPRDGNYPGPRDGRSRPEPRDGRRYPAPRDDDRAYSGDLVMPVAGVRYREIKDSFGDPRSGGREHKGIDIFAPRWTEVVAAAEGMVEGITNGGLGGRQLWVMGIDGRSYYYAHLEEWAPGLRNGARVAAGQLLGYVGNSGNAKATPTHLHFAMKENGRTVNPYPRLASARTVSGGTERVASARPRRTSSVR
ncbi:MAG TPA: M23 family metallopeptidase [Thermoanaerobaculia bacterium]